MKLEICQPAIWQQILYWTLIAANLAGSFYNMHRAIKNRNVLQVRLRLLQNEFEAHVEKLYPKTP